MKFEKARFYTPLTVCFFVLLGLVYYYIFADVSKSGTAYLYIDSDDTIDSVFLKLDEIGTSNGATGFRTIARHSSYPENIHTGRYAILPGEGALKVFHHVKNGLQSPINLTIPETRTLERLAAILENKLMLDSATIIETLTNEDICSQYGYDTTTVACMLIPNTYSVYWDTSMENFLKRMHQEHKIFWNEQRLAKAKALDLTPNEVYILASIIDEETSNNEEKPMIAGMYLNRLKANMPLQADPTIKFALQDFTIKRIYHKMLLVDSPYNTYRYEGLPPGPIKIASIAGIDAVLNRIAHPYLYMCAKEDFSGTHNFAVTYQEHLKNAEKYTKALNERGIE